MGGEKLALIEPHGTRDVAGFCYPVPVPPHPAFGRPLPGGRGGRERGDLSPSPFLGRGRGEADADVLRFASELPGFANATRSRLLPRSKGDRLAPIFMAEAGADQSRFTGARAGGSRCSTGVISAPPAPGKGLLRIGSGKEKVAVTIAQKLPKTAKNCHWFVTPFPGLARDLARHRGTLTVHIVTRKTPVLNQADRAGPGLHFGASLSGLIWHKPAPNWHFLTFAVA